MDEHLRRDAADVEARAAELAVLDDGDVEVVELRSGDRVARPGADDDEVVVAGRRRHRRPSVHSPSELLEQGGERLATMADRLLLGARHLGERAAVAGRRHEHAVVAEPVGAAWRRGRSHRRTCPRRTARSPSGQTTMAMVRKRARRSVYAFRGRRATSSSSPRRTRPVRHTSPCRHRAGRRGRRPRVRCRRRGRASRWQRRSPPP